MINPKQYFLSDNVTEDKLAKAGFLPKSNYYLYSRMLYDNYVYLKLSVNKTPPFYISETVMTEDGSIYHPFLFRSPPVPAGKPSPYSFVIRIRHMGIPENSLGHPALQGVHYRRGCHEIHIGDPHRQHIRIPDAVPFIRVGPPP